MGEDFLGQATICQLQTLQPFDEVIDKWVTLRPRPGTKEKEPGMFSLFSVLIMPNKFTFQVTGQVHLRLYYSVVPESTKLLSERTK